MADDAEELGRRGKYWCPRGERSGRIVICHAPAEETGENPIYQTKAKDGICTTENWCREQCKIHQKRK